MSAFRLVKNIDPLTVSVVTGGLVPRGAYNAGTDYAVGDQVSYNGSSYVMYVDAAAGTLPTDTTKWSVLASKGDTGATGATGAPGLVQTIVAGSNVSVDSTDPANPVVSATGAVSSITGTANQVLANGTSGSPQTGAVTLTLPQNIHSGATPVFDGVQANGSAGLQLKNNTGTTVLDLGAGGGTGATFAGGVIIQSLTASRGVYTGSGGLLQTTSNWAYDGVHMQFASNRMTIANDDGTNYALTLNHTGGTVGRNGLLINSSGTSTTTNVLKVDTGTITNAMLIYGSGNVGFGTTPSSQYRVLTTNTATNANTGSFQASGSVTVTDGTTRTTIGSALSLNVITTTADASNNAYALSASITGSYSAAGISNSGILMAGYFDGRINTASHAGTIASTHGLYVLHGASSASTGAGTLTSVYGQRIIADFSNPVTLTISTSFALSITGSGSTSYPANTWGVYESYATAASAANYFASQVLVGTTTRNVAKLLVRGTGTTSSTVGFRVEDSAGTQIMQVFDNQTTRIDTRLAVNANPNTSPATTATFYTQRSDSALITSSVFAARVNHDVTAGSNAGTFPSAVRFDINANSGASTIGYVGAAVFNAQGTNGHTGTITSMVGAETNVRINSQANITNSTGGVFKAGFFGANGTGTINANIGGLFAASSEDGASSSAIVNANTAGRFETRAPLGGITTNYGVRVITPSASATRTIATNYGIHIGTQTATGITTAYGIFFEGTNSSVSDGIAFRNGGIELYPAGADILRLGSGDSFQLEAANIITDTTTGTKIATGTTQKLGFWNATPVVQNTGWSTTNVVTDKSFDANATTLDEVADVLGTLIETLKTYGVLGEPYRNLPVT